MFAKAAEVLTTNAKLAVAAAAGAALVAGGGAVAVTTVSADSPASTGVSEHASDTGRAAALARGDNRSDTATATIAPPTSTGDDAAVEESKDNHGACVSAAVTQAKADVAQGEPNGPAVAAAARSCENPGSAKSAAGQARAEAARKAAEATRADAAKRSATQRDAAQQHRSDAGTHDPAGSRSTGTDASSEGRSHRPAHP